MTDTTSTEPKRRGNPAGLAKARQVRLNNMAKAKEQRMQAAAQPAKQSAPASEFEGLTATECCDNCSPKGCVVSGSWYCAHPMKAGLQAKEKGDHMALKRFKRAKEFLKDAKLDLARMSE